jgi:hypothetical protein
LNPPAIAELDASGALPPWVLLETRVYFAHRDDSTAASCKTSRAHHEIVVSIAFADPPALSYVCLRCPTLSTNNFVGEPRVLRSHKHLLLLHLPLTWTTSGVLKRSNEYYMYQVTDQDRKPRLSRIPDPSPDALLLPDDLGIYCAADAPGEYILAGLCPTSSDVEARELHLYSSKSNAWTMKPARLQNPKSPDRLPVTPHKVIPLGGSLLGWVDLWKGILVCDVLARPTRRRRPVPLRFIPFPARLPGNTTDHLCPWKVRDVACANGLLKFFEVEHYEVPTAIEKPVPADLPDVVYDDPPSVEPGDDSDTMAPSLYGWRSVIWNRVLSDNCWRLGCNVRFHDISAVENPGHSAFLDNGHAAGNSKTIDLFLSFPNLSIHGDDVVHMKSLVRLDGVSMRHMVSIDMRSKALKALVPCAAAKQDTYCPHFPSVLSNHLSNAPGN